MSEKKHEGGPKSKELQDLSPDLLVKESQEILQRASQIGSLHRRFSTSLYDVRILLSSDEVEKVQLTQVIPGIEWGVELKGKNNPFKIIQDKQAGTGISIYSIVFGGKTYNLPNISGNSQTGIDSVLFDGDVRCEIVRNKDNITTNFYKLYGGNTIFLTKIGDTQVTQIRIDQAKLDSNSFVTSLDGKPNGVIQSDRIVTDMSLDLYMKKIKSMLDSVSGGLNVQIKKAKDYAEQEKIQRNLKLTKWIGEFEKLSQKFELEVQDYSKYDVLGNKLRLITESMNQLSNMIKEGAIQNASDNILDSLGILQKGLNYLKEEYDVIDRFEQKARKAIDSNQSNIDLVKDKYSTNVDFIKAVHEYLGMASNMKQILDSKPIIVKQLYEQCDLLQSKYGLVDAYIRDLNTKSAKDAANVAKSQEKFEKF